MPSKKPKPMQTPYQSQQQATNTYGRFSIADSPEAQSFMETPLDFGDYSGLQTDIDVDPGVGRRTAVAEEEAGLRANSAFNRGVPRFLREQAQAKELRDIQGRGAYEAQQAQYMNQQARRGLEFRKAQLQADAAGRRTTAELERRRLLLPQYLQTGGSGSSSGFNTQIVTPPPGFWHQAGLSLIGGARSAATMMAGAGY